jgi:hypothetical protein
MVLFSSILVLLNNRSVINNFINIDNLDKTINNNIYLLLYISLVLILTTIPAVLVAVNCNKNSKLLYGFIAFFFSDIYLLQWSIKKFIMKSSGYCKI